MQAASVDVHWEPYICESCGSPLLRCYERGDHKPQSVFCDGSYCGIHPSIFITSASVRFCSSRKTLRCFIIYIYSFIDWLLHIHDEISFECSFAWSVFASDLLCCAPQLGPHRLPSIQRQHATRFIVLELSTLRSTVQNYRGAYSPAIYLRHCVQTQCWELVVPRLLAHPNLKTCLYIRLYVSFYGFCSIFQ